MTEPRKARIVVAGLDKRNFRALVEERNKRVSDAQDRTRQSVQVMVEYTLNALKLVCDLLIDEKSFKEHLSCKHLLQVELQSELTLSLRHGGDSGRGHDLGGGD